MVTLPLPSLPSLLPRLYGSEGVATDTIDSLTAIVANDTNDLSLLMCRLALATESLEQGQVCTAVHVHVCSKPQLSKQAGTIRVDSSHN